MKTYMKYVTAVVFSVAVLAAAGYRAMAEGSDAAQTCSPGEAITQYQAALDASPGNGEIMVNLALAYERVNWYGKSLVLWEDYSARFPNGTNAYMAKQHAAMNHRWIGSEQFLTGQPVTVAEEHLSRAISLDPGLIPAYIWLGRAYLSEARFNQASIVFMSASALAPKNNDVAEIGENITAMMYSQGSSRADIQQGIALYDNGNMESALSAFRSVEKTRPQLAVVHYWLGKIYYEQGRFAQAIPEFTALKQTDRDSYRFASFLSEAQLMEGNKALELALYQRPEYSYDSFAAGTSRTNFGDISTAASLSSIEDRPVLACVPE